MKEYKETQFGWLILLTLLPAQAWLTFMFLKELGLRPMGLMSFIFISLILLITYLLFFRLTTTLNSDHIRVSFGIGLIQKRIKLSEIKAVEVVHNPWYYGWGLRFFPNGVLYNISGSKGIELKFNSSGRVVRIGSKESGLLKQQIVQRLAVN